MLWTSPLGGCDRLVPEPGSFIILGAFYFGSWPYLDILHRHHDSDSSHPPRFVLPHLLGTQRIISQEYRSLSAYHDFTYPATRALLRALVPSRVDLLPPRKRFRDSISTRRICVMEDMIRMSLLGRCIRTRFKDEVKLVEEVLWRLEGCGCLGLLYLMYDYADNVRVFGQNMTITRSGMTLEAIEELVNRRVEEVLAAYEATRTANALEAENQSQNGNDSHNGNADVAFSMTWRELMKLMTEVYCPRTKIQKMESELWNLTVKNNDLAAYTQRFQELTMMCTKMVPEEEGRVEKFIGGLPDNIQGNVIAAEPTRLQDAVRIANNLMEQRLKGYAMKNVENKRKFDNSQKDNRGQQPPNKRQKVGGQNVARAYTAGNNERRVYNGPLPLYNKCKFHHEGPCIVRCGKCKKVGHLTRDCKAADSTTSNQRGQVVNQRVLTCFECGKQGHYRSDWPKLKEQNRGNKTGNKNGVGEARRKAYVLGGGDANPDSNVVTGTFLLNNHYAYVLFDSGADPLTTRTEGAMAAYEGTRAKCNALDDYESKPEQRRR
ncbi:reverse transcriptase domain-containing protein [Tanacetum coccineum]|uniref:Reverse transcriptase domain-containing protein n=1 Tax=Tanacetum coccineum TaxID=301880 RepID=A0ABQ5ENW1_9ASTR